MTSIANSGNLPSKVEQRVVIHFLFLENMQPTEIYQRMHTVYSENYVMSYSSVEHWVQMLKEGRSQVEDEPHSGCWATSVNKETVSIMRLLLQEDKH